ncbi:MAG: hydroxymethylglutaryl-CoA lyase [Frankiaceae bacterium]|nr:hydroxymethylglutaryl-CoA lyase [Arenimonas sp.]
MLFTDTPRRVLINEVAVRDGFQSEPAFIPTEEKISLIDRLSATGLAKIEVTSFVSPKAIPNLRDAQEVMHRIRRNPAVVYAALVPNERGAQRALECKVDEINLVMSVGEIHNIANMRMSHEMSLTQFQRVMALVDGSAMRVNGCVATAFGCPFDGAQPVRKVMDVVAQYLAMGMHSITLADTTGMASPRQVGALCQAFFDSYRDVPLTLHFHNTRGMGLANVIAALDAGANSFDASLGGIGGCPFAPGATGNICTEDLVHMLHACAIDTGVDLDLLLSIARDLPAVVGHDVPGQIIRAGKTTDLHTRPVASV